MKEIEEEEINRLQLIKPLSLPDFRVGDVVEFKWVHNMSEPNMNVYQGLIVARRNKNSLEGSFKVIFRFCGVEVFMNVKQYSPFLREFRILKRGSGNIRNKQAIWRHTLTKQYLLTPIIKGRPRQRRDDPPRRFTRLQKLNYQMQKIKDPYLQE